MGGAIEGCAKQCCAPGRSDAEGKELFAKALQQFPVIETEGLETSSGSESIEKNFDKLKLFAWGKNGKGKVTIQRVQTVTMAGTAEATIEINELIGFLSADSCDKGKIQIKEANVVHLAHLTGTQVEIEKCNYCIIRDCRLCTFTIKSGIIVAVENGSIAVKCGKEATFKHVDADVGIEPLVEGEAAEEMFKKEKGANFIRTND